MLLFEYQLFLNTLNIYIFIKIFIYQDYFLLTKKYKFFHILIDIAKIIINHLKQ